MGQSNQLYCRFIRLLPNPEDLNELYLVIAKDKPMNFETIKDFERRYIGKDIIITITNLVRDQKKKTKRKPEGNERHV